MSRTFEALSEKQEIETMENKNGHDGGNQPSTNYDGNNLLSTTVLSEDDALLSFSKSRRITRRCSNGRKRYGI
jgi:hypothetical protein